MSRPRSSAIIAYFLLSTLIGACRPEGLEWAGATLVPNIDTGALREPTWSPDAQRIAVITESQPPRPTGTILVTSIDGTDRVMMAQACQYYEVHWDPSGSRLIFNGCDGIDLARYPDLTIENRISGDYATWSPDGKQLAVVQLGNFNFQRPTTLAISNLSGITATVPFSETQAGSSFGGIAWSPSGNWIAMSYGFDAQAPLAISSRDVYIIDPSGSQSFLLDDMHQDAFDPSWSPNGNWLAYIGRANNAAGEVGTLFLARVDGTCTIEGYSHSELSGVDWSPLGNSLAVTFRDQLYVVDIEAMLGYAYAELDSLCPAP